MCCTSINGSRVTVSSRWLQLATDESTQLMMMAFMIDCGSITPGRHQTSSESDSARYWMIGASVVTPAPNHCSVPVAIWVPTPVTGSIWITAPFGDGFAPLGVVSTKP